MKHYRIIQTEKKELHNVTCNMCGKSINRGTDNHFDSFLSIDKVWGYGSAYDGEKHSIDLCLECYGNFLHTLRIPPGEPQD